MALALEGSEIAVGEVLAEDEDEEADTDVHEPRDEEGEAPGSEGGGAGLADDVVDEGHDELGGPAAHVAPPGGGAVGEADDLAVEHGGHPVLAWDEGGEGEADEEAHGDVAGGVGDEGHAEDGGGGEHDEEDAPVAGAEHVTDGAHDETGEDGAGDGGDASVADVGLGEVEVVADDGDEGGGGEGGDEAGEEGEPGEVEGEHVRLGQGEEAEGFGLVLRVHRQREHRRRVRRHRRRRHLVSQRRLVPRHSVHWTPRLTHWSLH